MSKYLDDSNEDIQSVLGKDSFYVRNLLKHDNDDSQVYFKTILTCNKVPSIPSHDSGYRSYYGVNKQDNLKSECNTITNYQKQSKGIRRSYHDKQFTEITEQNKRVMIPVLKAKRIQLDEVNTGYEEQKGVMKRMTGGDNILLQGSGGSMDYQSRRKWILSSIDENLLNSSRSDSNNNSYTVDELRDFLRKLNLKVSGNKSELVERLLFEKDVLNFDVD